MGLRKLFSILTLNERGLSYAIDKKRKLISRRLGELTGNTVRYGPFKGLKLPDVDWWGGAERGAMLLGLYEQEVQHSIMQVASGRDVFVDLGAADGFYSVGMLITGRFKTSYAFERSPKGREVIAQNAVLNGCGSKVKIFGRAGPDFDNALSSEELARSVILIDVEGAEFEILTNSTLQRLRHSVVFIELHDWFFPDGEEKLARLLADARSHYSISTLTMGARDLSMFPELIHYDDSERWLLASEGRNRLMTWLRFDPLATDIERG
jgi:hypothetical protein